MASGTCLCDATPIRSMSMPRLEVIRTIDPAGETEDIVIYLTDLARRLGTTPVIGDISFA
jgi:hypothetical protein